MATTKTDLRARIFTPRALPTRLVTSRHMPDVTIEIRTLTYGARAALVRSCKDEETGDIDGIQLTFAALIACAFDPESGEQVFTKGDVEQVEGLPSVLLDDWAFPALELNGLAPDAVRAAVGNSEATPSSSTSSSSSLEESAVAP